MCSSRKPSGALRKAGEHILNGRHRRDIRVRREALRPVERGILHCAARDEEPTPESYAFGGLMQRARRVTCFDDHCRVTECRHQFVAFREVALVHGRARGELRHQEVVTTDLLLERRVADRVHLLERCPDDRDHASTCFDRGGQGFRINAAGKPGDNDDAVRDQLSCELSCAGRTVRGHVTGADNGDRARLHQLKVSSAPETRSRTAVSRAETMLLRVYDGSTAGEKVSKRDDGNVFGGSVPPRA
jgi:hypothetical protein